MKFSVLLPTRNRLELLTYAVETVRRQNYDDWEVIISDNCSEEDVSGYVQSLNDPRIKYCRTAAFIPVTDNWNNALEKSTGDYVIMLGDDDCLMKGFFTTIRSLIETYHDPDFIYTNAFLYAYPGVLPDLPDGFLKPYSFASFFRSAKGPFWLHREQALDLVRHSMNFKMLFTYNMQHSIISRKVIETLKPKGSFFQSPYPDFYASNVLLLKAERILICPFPLVTVGISPKSFGFYFFNKREEQGVEFLKNLADPSIIDRLQQVILPGSKDRTSWLIAMETIKANYGPEFNLRVNYKRYRYLQILFVYWSYYKDKPFLRPGPLESKARITAIHEYLHWWEKFLYVPFIWLGARVIKVLPLVIIRKIATTVTKAPKLDMGKSEQHYVNILDVFERVEP